MNTDPSGRTRRPSDQVSTKTTELHVSMLAIEANDEWLVGRSYISQKSMATLSDPRPERNPPLDQDKEVELIAA